MDHANAAARIDLLLLNDTTFAPYLPTHFRVLSVGPKALYVMPEQDRFDIWLPDQLEHDLSEVLLKCREKVPDFDPQVIIQFETSQNYFYRGIEKSPALTIWRLIDTHMFYHWQPIYAQLFDVSLVAQRDYLPMFTNFTPRAFWLPLNGNQTVHRDRGVPRDIPVSFVGSMNPVVHPERVRFFQALQGALQDALQYAPQEALPGELPSGSCLQLFSGKSQHEISEIYNRSLIVVNECLHKDLNYRLFEALANGALCVTPRIDAGQSDLFIDGQDIVEYEDKDVNAAKNKILELLKNRARLEHIRCHGRDKVMAYHDIRHRAQQVVELVERYLEDKPERRLNGQNLTHIVSLLGEFTFALHKVGGRHMQDLLHEAARLDPLHTARYLTSLSRRWYERNHLDAARYFLTEAEAIPVTDQALTRVQGLIRQTLG